jgi:hypothetical protein
MDYESIRYRHKLIREERDRIGEKIASLRHEEARTRDEILDAIEEAGITRWPGGEPVDPKDVPLAVSLFIDSLLYGEVRVIEIDGKTFLDKIVDGVQFTIPITVSRMED